MTVPKGSEVEYEGVAYILVDADLLLRLNPGKNVCSLCELRTPCGGFDCIIDGPEIGIYVRKLREG